ncbi:MAG: rhomboid family intramembrane serine protease [Proteobacteria bacterium]|nr:rhomboid family intramembrane serine protease [Pseudomonadota bacterium]
MSTSLIIIAVTCIVSIMGFSNTRLVDQLILWPPAISRGKEYYRLVSYGLVHADPMHLFFNMFTLYFFGRVMEQLYDAILGPLGFVLFYAGALVASILPTYLRNRGNSRYRSLGASGAVSATLFAFILLQPWAQILVFVIPMPAILFAVLYLAYEFWLERRGVDNINHNAHLWGAAYGVLVTILLEPRVLGIFLSQLTGH